MRVHRFVLAVAGVAVTATFARAQTTVTFDALGALDPSAGVNYVDNCYVESGYRFTAVGDACGMAASFASYSPADPTGYTGSRALFSAYQPSIDIQRDAGGAFSLLSIDLAPFLLGGADVNPIAVLFTGNYLIGGTVSNSFTIPMGTGAAAKYTLSGFTNVTSVRLTVQRPDFEPYVQMDNLVFAASASTVPEPATLALVALGAAGIAGAGAVRRRVARR